MRSTRTKQDSVLPWLSCPQVRVPRALRWCAYAASILNATGISAAQTHEAGAHHAASGSDASLRDKTARLRGLGHAKRRRPERRPGQGRQGTRASPRSGRRRRAGRRRGAAQPRRWGTGFIHAPTGCVRGHNSPALIIIPSFGRTDSRPPATRPHATPPPATRPRSTFSSRPW